MKKKLYLLSVFILCALVVCSCTPAADKTTNSLALEAANRYELFIGLNDVDSGKQELDTQETIEIIKMKILKNVSGVTMTVSNGSYYVGALVVDETTLNCVIYGADDEAIAALVDEINSELNLSVLVAKSTSDYRLITP
ncbi:hypothetical protein [Acetobacterium woodii]|uniref:Lipoprotein n=1 Tax=Acetobacterium woodii (strain ATCC 29683 / DSM 1030 / JCM 2381 / KCTC 1655 / WB1) TaxID=931626 RepID=H6LC42_ACEWD|nr:hypothetical protein [Acetobacterium woodii]AFA48990.1 hypothetical protein Awo_c22160 [Acetobacterium woodii DSM 1030]